MSSASANQENGSMQSRVQYAISQLKSDASIKSLTLKWINPQLVDVFRGEGWENWSRFQKKGNHYEMVSGQPLSNQEYVELKNGR